MFRQFTTPGRQADCDPFQALFFWQPGLKDCTTRLDGFQGNGGLCCIQARGIKLLAKTGSPRRRRVEFARCGVNCFQLAAENSGASVLPQHFLVLQGTGRCKFKQDPPLHRGTETPMPLGLLLGLLEMLHKAGRQGFCLGGLVLPPLPFSFYFCLYPGKPGLRLLSWFRPCGRSVSGGKAQLVLFRCNAVQQ
ncbi:hypothetical protein D3C73_1172560 [compost metagenome]